MNHAPKTKAATAGSTPRSAPRKRRLWLAAGLAVLSLGAWLAWNAQTEPVIAQASPAAKPGWGAGGNPFEKGSASEQTPLLLPQATPLASSAEALGIDSSSLTGTQADGDWSVDAQGRLVPHRSLRRRFDYYLSLIGERDLAAISVHVQAQTRAQLGAPASAAVMDIWSRYTALQQHAWKTRVDPQQPASWAQALQERRWVRRERLGPAWAQAFYGEEERALEQTIAQVNSGLPAAAQESALNTAPTPLPDAPQRLSQADAEWAGWERRLSSAREQISALQSAPQLSPLQREQAVDRLLNEQFDERERMRVRALLQL